MDRSTTDHRTVRPIDEAYREARALLTERIGDLDDPAEIAFAAAQLLGELFEVTRAGYGTVDRYAETISIERDWNAPSVRSLAGVLQFRDYGTYIDDLKRHETVIVADTRSDPRTRDQAEALAGIGVRSFINMPIAEQGGFVGLLFVNHVDAREWTDDELSLMRDFGQRTRGAVARRVAERELRELAASLEQQVVDRTRERDRTWNNSRDLLAVVDQAGRFEAVNPAWTTLLGWRPAELIGRQHLEMLHPEGRSDARSLLVDPGGSKHFENRIVHRDGSFRWFSWITSLEDGRTYASGRHVTADKEAQAELMKAQEQLRQSQKMEAVGQLTGGLAHDFNNLLTGITGSLELLKIRIAQGRAEEIGRYVNAAMGAANRAANLTHRLLAFSRRQTLDPKVVDVNRLVSDLEDLIRRTVGPGVAVEVVGAPSLWNALIDANQLENALLNLAINARDAMPNGGKLTIETANRWLDDRAARERELSAGQYVALCVTDTGTGMSPETVARAFDPFFTTKPLGEGTGLGLSMVYGFAKQSGGQVRIYSEVGQGTTMCIYMPRHASTDVVIDEEDDPPATNIDAGLTALIVDDEPTIRMLLNEVLTDEGFNVMEAVDGATSLVTLRSAARIDLMITDVGLPGGINGRQVADAARALRPGLKVLFITGYAENSVINSGALAQGMSVLTKPFTVPTLTRRIAELIDAPS